MMNPCWFYETEDRRDEIVETTKEECCHWDETDLVRPVYLATGSTHWSICVQPLSIRFRMHIHRVAFIYIYICPPFRLYRFLPCSFLSSVHQLLVCFSSVGRILLHLLHLIIIRLGSAIATTIPTITVAAIHTQIQTYMRHTLVSFRAWRLRVLNITFALCAYTGSLIYRSTSG